MSIFYTEDGDVGLRIGEKDVGLTPSTIPGANFPDALIAHNKNLLGPAVCMAFADRYSVQVMIDKLTDLRDKVFPPDDDCEAGQFNRPHVWPQGRPCEDSDHFSQSFIPFRRPAEA